MSQNISEKKMIERVISIMESLKLSEIKEHFVGGRSPLADYFVIATADSMLQLDASRSKIVKELSKMKIRLRNPNEDYKGGWLIMDYGNVVVNIFLEEKRRFYNLDELLLGGNFDLEEIKDGAG